MMLLMNLVLIQVILALPLAGGENFRIWQMYVWACSSFGVGAAFMGQMFLSQGWNRWVASSIFGLFVPLITLIGAWAQEARNAGDWQFAMSPPFVEASLNSFGWHRIYVLFAVLFVTNLLVGARLLQSTEWVPLKKDR